MITLLQIFRFLEMITIFALSISTGNTIQEWNLSLYICYALHFKSGHLNCSDALYINTTRCLSYFNSSKLWIIDDSKAVWYCLVIKPSINRLHNNEIPVLSDLHNQSKLFSNVFAENEWRLYWQKFILKNNKPIALNTFHSGYNNVKENTVTS